MTMIVRTRILFLLFLCKTSSIITAFTSSTTTTRTACCVSTRKNDFNFVRSSILFQSNNDAKNDSTIAENPTTTNTAAQDLLEKAAKIRAEIAAMEGKTLEEVEKEAKDKKASEQERRRKQQEEQQVAAAAAATATTTNDGSNKPYQDNGRFLQVPNTYEDMVRQAARAVERAFQDGKTRQTVRFNLINVKEEQSPDEENEWPGGAKQIYRESAKPLTTELLREIRAPPTTTNSTNENLRRLPPTIKEQDIWDFDGSALHTAEAAEGPSGDIQALVLPNTDVKYIRDIEEISNVMKNRLFVLVNPFWKDIESWSFNILAPNAKQKAQTIIFDEGYDETYNMLVFQVRGEKCVGLKAYPYDWQIFAYIEDYDYGGGYETAIRLGSCKEQPTSKFVTDLLNKRPEFKETKTMRQMKKMF